LGADEKSAQGRPLKKQQSKAIRKSYLPDVLETWRVWGISLQFYELRSTRNWGIADFEDLIGMIRLAQSLGAISSGSTRYMRRS
jgi:4-alpha-glucanotransferase